MAEAELYVSRRLTPEDIAYADDFRQTAAFWQDGTPEETTEMYDKSDDDIIELRENGMRFLASYNAAERGITFDEALHELKQ